MQSRLHKVGWEILDLLFPPRCGGCDTWGTRWCDSCQQSTRLIDTNICPICGEPQPTRGGLTCVRCRNLRIYFDNVRSWALFDGPLRNAVHELKYKKNVGLAARLAEKLASLYRAQGWHCSVVIPIPLGAKRLVERGYNQATLLARPLAWTLNIPLLRNGLSRVVETKSQVGLSRSERRENVHRAFAARPRLVEDECILLVDDVITTGATMNACAQALREMNARGVYGITVARAELSHG